MSGTDEANAHGKGPSSPMNNLATFLTGLKDDNKDESLLAFEKLNQAVDDIEGQFQFVLDLHKSEFLNAYKGHMVKVHKELEFLKKRANEATGKLMNDDTVTNLRSSISWFKNEALKLDGILDN